MKKFITIVIRICLVVILLAAVSFAGLFAYYLVTKKSAEDYLPSSFIAYLRISSIGKFYDSVIDLRAAETVFAEVPQLKSINKAITDFKSEEISRSFYLKRLLDVEAHAVIDSSQTPVLIFDPGLLSLPIQLFPVVNLFVKVEGLNLDIIQRGKITIYSLEVSEKDRVYFCINNNLILASTKIEPIEKCFAIHESGETLAKNEEAAALSGKIRKKGKAYIVVNTEAVLSMVAQGNDMLRAAFKDVTFNGYSALSFDVSNTELSIEAVTSFSTKNETLRSFVTYAPPGLRSLTVLPDTTSVYSSVSPRSVEELIRIVSMFKERDEGKLVKQIDDACRLVFGKSADELLFGWIGSEAGAVTLEGSAAPVLFIRHKDRGKLEAALEAIAASIYVDQDSSLVLDELRLTKIVLPDFIKGIASMFVKGLDTPYYLILGDYIFFSMDAKNLVSIEGASRSNKTIVRSEAYRSTAIDMPINGHVSLYYNTESQVPDFLGRDNLVTRILASYGRGMVSVYFREDEVRIRVSASGTSQAAVSMAPGYPKLLPGGISTDVVVSDVKGSKTPEFVYAGQDGKLYVYDPIDGTSRSQEIERDSSIRVVKNPATGRNEIYVLGGSGILYKFDGEANPVPPFPIQENYKGSFPPAEWNGRVVLFSQEKKALQFVSSEGTVTDFGFAFDEPLLGQPAFSGRIVSFYPKSFSGTVYCTDGEGTLLPGWPKDGNGISTIQPVIFKDRDGKTVVAFISQAGVLNAWDMDGSSLPGFPVDLGGVFAADLAIVSEGIVSGGNGAGKAILALNTDGTFYVVDTRATILAQKQVPGTGGKNSRVYLFDFDRDGIEEIFVYGSSNYITALDNGPEIVPGFPVKGSKKCAFVDVDGDGRRELVAGSFDGNVYAYEVGN